MDFVSLVIKCNFTNCTYLIVLCLERTWVFVVHGNSYAAIFFPSSDPFPVSCTNVSLAWRVLPLLGFCFPSSACCDVPEFSMLKFTTDQKLAFVLVQWCRKTVSDFRQLFISLFTLTTAEMVLQIKKSGVTRYSAIICVFHDVSPQNSTSFVYPRLITYRENPDNVSENFQGPRTLAHAHPLLKKWCSTVMSLMFETH